MAEILNTAVSKNKKFFQQKTEYIGEIKLPESMINNRCKSVTHMNRVYTKKFHHLKEVTIEKV